MKTDENQFNQCNARTSDATNGVKDRRRFLKATGAALLGTPAVAGLFASGDVLAGSRNHSGHVPLTKAAQASPLQGALVEMDGYTTRRLHLVNEHTGDDINVVYYTHGIYLNDNISMLNHLMRDRRANVATQMDTTLYNQLFLLRTRLGTDEPVHVLSGYRTPETNARLRKRSKRVAKYSLHMEGRAADIYIPGFSVKQIQGVAVSLKAGGVGLYSKSNFVHIDTGQIRYWGG